MIPTFSYFQNLNIYRLETPIKMRFLVHKQKFYQLLGNQK